MGKGNAIIRLEPAAAEDAPANFSFDSLAAPGIVAIYTQSEYVPFDLAASTRRTASLPVPHNMVETSQERAHMREDIMAMSYAQHWRHNSRREFIIGPAFEHTDVASVRAVIAQWVNDYGFTSLAPLLDEAVEFSIAVHGLNPKTDIEKRAAALLAQMEVK